MTEAFDGLTDRLGTRGLSAVQYEGVLKQLMIASCSVLGACQPALLLDKASAKGISDTDTVSLISP